jgi:hypothetical protein
MLLDRMMGSEEARRASGPNISLHLPVRVVDHDIARGRWTWSMFVSLDWNTTPVWLAAVGEVGSRGLEEPEKRERSGPRAACSP